MPSLGTKNGGIVLSDRSDVPSIDPRIRAWNDTATSYPDDRSIAALFADQVRARPDAVAVSAGRRQLTYQDLDRWSARLAARLVGSGVEAGEPVGLVGERSLEAAVGMLAVVKAAAVYVPLDGADPPGRLAALVGELKIRRQLTTPGYGTVLGELVPSLAIADFQSGEEEVPLPLPTVSVGGQQLAYIIFTSGSTGRPKAVGVPHRAVARLVVDTDYVRFSPQDRVANTGHLSFDASVFEIWGALLNGARLVVVDADTLLEPRRLADFLRGEEITVLWLSAGIFHNAARSDPAMFGRLRYLVTGGDVLIPEFVREVLRAGPPGHLVNGYGPTENATFSTTQVVTAVPPGTTRIPIGRPISNSTCYVVKADGEFAGIGEEGELYVGGDGVAAGYVNSPQLTAERFFPDPFGRRPGSRLFRTGDRGRWLPDGTLDFLGRRDRMVKVRDFRIELDEIETVLSGCPAVGAAAVVTVGDDAAARTVVAYVTPARLRPGLPPTSAELRAYLAARLPAFMLPARYVVLDRLPLTPRGKVDRPALASVAPVSTSSRGAPATPLEVGLARIWQEVLDVPQVGPEDSFFELGGNSLFAAQVFTRLRTIFGVGPEQTRFLTRRLLADPSLRACAAALQDARAGTLTHDDEGRAIDFDRESRLDVPVPAASSGLVGAAIGEVLLTGATGFVGCYLLRELLRVTDARVHCLVRAADAGHAWRRLVAAQSQYELGDLPRDRVVPLVGDLARPRLGLREETFDWYARTTDLVLHAGADVNFMYPYAHVARTTVGGTREVIRLAARHRGIPVHFVSTLAVLAAFGAAGVPRVTESTPLAFPEHLYMGYTEAKWVAEQLLQAATRAGLPVAIHRPYEVSGDRRLGAWNLSNATWAMFGVMVASGCAPRIDMPLDLVPVDVLAAQIVHIATTRTRASRTYHLTNPRPARLSDMVQRLRAAGYPIEELDLDAWVARTVGFVCAHPEHPFTPFVPLWVDRSPRSGLVVKEMYFAATFPSFTRGNAEAALAGSEIQMPAVEDLLDLYVQALQRSGFIPHPPARR